MKNLNHFAENNNRSYSDLLIELNNFRKEYIKTHKYFNLPAEFKITIYFRQESLRYQNQKQKKIDMHRDFMYSFYNTIEPEYETNI